MDYKGQALFDSISCWFVVVWGLLAFLVGYVVQDFPLMARIYGIGSAALLVLLPDHKWWPPSWLFNKHPLRWLPELKPPNAPPLPPTLPQRVLKLLGLGGSSKGPSKASKASAGRRAKGGKAR